MVVLSPPGMIRPRTSASCSGLRIWQSRTLLSAATQRQTRFASGVPPPRRERQPSRGRCSARGRSPATPTHRLQGARPTCSFCVSASLAEAAASPQGCARAFPLTPHGTARAGEEQHAGPGGNSDSDATLLRSAARSVSAHAAAGLAPLWGPGGQRARARGGGAHTATAFAPSRRAYRGGIEVATGLKTQRVARAGLCRGRRRSTMTALCLRALAACALGARRLSCSRVVSRCARNAVSRCRFVALHWAAVCVPETASRAASRARRGAPHGRARARDPDASWGGGWDASASEAPTYADGDEEDDDSLSGLPYAWGEWLNQVRCSVRCSVVDALPALLPH